MENRITLRSQLQELENIRNEISRLRKVIKQLHNREKELERSSIEIMKASGNDKGVKFNGNAVLLETKTVCKKRRKCDREQQLMRVLSETFSKSLGEQEQKCIIKSINSCLRGEEHEEMRVMIKRPKLDTKETKT